ncbi:MAG: response regulator [Desulfamplus sp.]|nr:response regulator [Desulfamplus sp.]
MSEKIEYKYNKKILIVDDDTMLLNLFDSLLIRSGYETKAFSSSTEALQYIINNYNEIGLILSDFQMPYLTGLELAIKINGDKLNIPVIICSGSHPDEIDQDKFIEGGVVHLLHKPVSNKELLATIIKYVTN